MTTITDIDNQPTLFHQILDIIKKEILINEKVYNCRITEESLKEQLGDIKAMISAWCSLNEQADVTDIRVTINIFPELCDKISKVFKIDIYLGLVHMNKYIIMYRN